MRISKWFLQVAAAAFVAPMATVVLAAPSMTLNVNPTSGDLATQVTVTATIAGATCGSSNFNYRVLRNVDTTVADFEAFVNPATDQKPKDWVRLQSDVPVGANGSASVTVAASAFSPAQAGDKVELVADFAPTGSCGSGAIPFNNPFTPTTTFMVSGTPAAYCPDGATTGVHIAIKDGTGVGSPPPGYSGTWSYKVELTACEALQVISAQGGSNGWTNKVAFPTATVGTAAVRNDNLRNQVLLWTLGANLAAGDKAVLDVALTGAIKNSRTECGKTKLLNGDWSAIFTTDGGLTKQKSAYTTYTSTVTVDGGVCP